MKRINFFVLALALILFIAPFAWLAPGFVDLGGDSGRLYFLDPLASAINVYGRQNFSWAPYYSIIPYELFLYGLKQFVDSPTNLISFTRGLHLSLAFLSMYFIVRTFLFSLREVQKKLYEWVSVTSGVVYVGFLSNAGWVMSLETHYQGFLNPLIFYLLLRLCLSASHWPGFAILIISILYSGNFGFSAMPQLMSFYPMAILFLLVSLRFVFRVAVPWKKLFVIVILFVGLHAFHLIPTVATLLDTTTTRHSQIFSSESIQNSGVHYFEVNHKALGKISTQLFQFLFVPIVILLGFVIRPTKFMAIIGGFFAATLFLVSANITHLGVSLYKTLFYIPGFMMFRSFNDKWYYVYIFFFTLLFGMSLYAILTRKKIQIVVFVSLLFIALTVYGTRFFWRGMAIDTPHYQSNSVSPIFTVDPNLLTTLSYIRTLPEEGKFLTLPLTFPYFQIAYGSEGGAYAGVSMILHLANRADYPGFWSMGALAQPVFDAIGAKDWDTFLRLLSELNVRYIFYNSDTRIIDNFPAYPYIYPGLMYSSKDQLPAIADQEAYKSLLAELPLNKIYERGFYSVYEIEYPEPPVFIANFETTPHERQYFFVGRLVSGITVGILMLLTIREITRRKHEKN